MEVIRWFPLDRVESLELAIARELRSSRKARRRDAVAVALGLHGMRVGEIVVAQVKHFLPALRQLEVPSFKRGIPRKVPLHSSLVAALQRELQGRSVASPWLLAARTGNPLDHKQPQTVANDIFCRLLCEDREEAGHECLHGLTFHSLRHTFAMRLYAETRDLFLVQRQLGHRSVKSTEVYARSLADVPDGCLVNVSDAATPPPLRVVG